MLCPAHSSCKFPNERRSRTSSRHNSSLSRKGQQFANKGTLLRSYCKSAFNLWEYLLFKSQYFIGFHLSVFFTHSKFSEETKVQVDSKLIKVPRQVRLGHGRWNSIANGFMCGSALDSAQKVLHVFSLYVCVLTSNRLAH